MTVRMISKMMMMNKVMKIAMKLKLMKMNFNKNLVRVKSEWDGMGKRI